VTREHEEDDHAERAEEAGGLPIGRDAPEVHRDVRAEHDVGGEPAHRLEHHRPVGALIVGHGDDAVERTGQDDGQPVERDAREDEEDLGAHASWVR
jgi:hypothetical protein